jgi:hypothetical protein
MGDVASSSQPVGLRGVAGRGITLTNEPLEHASAFETIDFRGDLPTGYEVELYRNDVLIGSTRNAVSSQYEFIKVPVGIRAERLPPRLLRPGRTTARGSAADQCRRRTARAGAFVYNLSAVQRTRPCSDCRPPDTCLRSIRAWRGSLEIYMA